MCLAVALKNCLARMGAAAALAFAALAVCWPRRVMNLGAGMRPLDTAALAAAAGVAAAGAAGAGGLRKIGGPSAGLVYPSGLLFSRRLTERLAPVVRFLRGIGIPILLVLRCLCFPAMPTGMPPVLLRLLVPPESSRIVACPMVP